MTIEQIVAGLTCIFLIFFAANDLKYREISNKTVGVFAVFVLACLAAYQQTGLLDAKWLCTSIACVFLMCLLYYGGHLIGGADFKIITLLSIIFGPAAVFCTFAAAAGGLVWKKLFVRDGIDTIMNLEWKCIPLMFFYLFAFSIATIGKLVLE